MEETPSEPTDPPLSINHDERKSSHNEFLQIKPPSFQATDSFTFISDPVNTQSTDDAVDGMIRQRSARQNTSNTDPEKQDGGSGIPRKRNMVVSRLALVKSVFTPYRAIGPQPTFKAGLIAIMKYSPLNFLLLFVPVSWVLHFTHQSATLVFVFSALAIVPLAALLGLGTEQIALRTSQSVGGLLNASLGNVVELIISGIALKQCELSLVQSSLLGGLLSNLLLVLGMAFVVGGFRFSQSEFQPIAAQLNSSLMTVAVISLIVPSAFHEFLADRLEPGVEGKILLELSRGSAFILIMIYVAYLWFQFHSHRHFFLETEQTTRLPRSSNTSSNSTSSSDSARRLPRTMSSNSNDTEEPILAKLNTITAILLLIAVTAVAYLTAEHLISSLEAFTESNPSISREWLTLIIIPIISNAAEHATAVVVASKGKFDLALSVAVGSCIQIALFVIPLLIIVAWIMGKPLTLLFDPLETLCLFFSVLVVKFSIEDGRAHWLSGCVLIGVYALIALNFWHFPNAESGIGEGAREAGLVCFT